MSLGFQKGIKVRVTWGGGGHNTYTSYKFWDTGNSWGIGGLNERKTRGFVKLIEAMGDFFKDCNLICVNVCTSDPEASNHT